MIAEILLKNEGRGFDTSIELHDSEIIVEHCNPIKEKIDAKKEMYGVYPRLIIIKLLTTLSRDK